MPGLKNITIIGTSHVSKNSIKEIEETFNKFQPGIIAVELDKSRLEALLTNQKPSYSPKIIRQIGVTGYFFALIGGMLQRKIGDFLGVSPGSEMKRAALLARDHSRKLALIDQDVRVTLRRLSQEFTFKQKMRLIWDVISSPFSKKKRIDFDLSKVPEDKVINELLKLLEKRYPGIYKALITERNVFMANKITSLAERFPEEKILVVVGAGHKEDVVQRIEKKLSIMPK
jgi:pheromone shutdown-related protein TraB